jgi:hypothetical protein
MPSAAPGGVKIANASLARPVQDALRCYTARRAKLPRRIPVCDVVDGDVVKLAVERKHLTDVVKMVAYQVETDLVRRIGPHYRRADDEARTLVQSMLANAGDIAVTATELCITFALRSSPPPDRCTVRRDRRARAALPRYPAPRPLRPSHSRNRTLSPRGRSGGRESAQAEKSPGPAELLRRMRGGRLLMSWTRRTVTGGSRWRVRSALPRAARSVWISQNFGSWLY